jgi:predicted unusual protein kinase regulating ubiquinone biosynthesis (AarF/ABC1/UbiB family)
MNAPHPFTVQAMRRWQTSSLSTSFNRPNATTLYYQLLGRWKRNFSRLYARRLFEIAAASAATQRLRTDLEAAIDTPENWKNWQAQDWEETALASLGRSKISRFWMAAKRMATLTALTSPLMVLMPLSYVSSTAQDASWKYALWGIEQAGPTWIKLVQWATTRQDLFSPEFCQYFGKLRDDTEGHAWKDTVKILQNELGDARGALEVDPKPIGSGCIAQVYRGRLTEATPHYPKDTKVAIKVQHPGIWHKVCMDFYILIKMAKGLEAIPYVNLEYLSLVDTVRQFRDIMLPQLDLTLEANHLRRFNRDFANDEQVSFPRPLGELTTTQVLTETFVEGTPIMEYTKEGTPIDERRQLAYLGLATTLKMIFLNDFVHGDLHPGNILVSGKHPNLKMHLLDCGLVIEMGPEQHANVVKVLGAFTRRNGTLAGQLMVDMKSESQASPRDVELFVRGIEQICIMDEDQVRVRQRRCVRPLHTTLLIVVLCYFISCSRTLSNVWETTLRTFAIWRVPIASSWSILL